MAIMIVPLVLRAVQLLFSAIVLGISISLIRGQVHGAAPSQTDFSAFAGGWGLLIALVGIAATTFFAALEGIAMLALDGLAILFYLAAALAMAVTLRVHKCTNENFTTSNALINGGLRDNKYYRYIDLQGRCHKAQADTAFLFFAFAAFVGTAVLSGMAGRRKGARGGAMV
ncbi:MAG: hypothetical protein M1830_004789 [Pleopsidium flavum]|nr:MAG: hypothetical protein M1830_004789 [Pleopsidium flavum]